MADTANPLDPSKPQPLTRPKLLVGEGKEEFNFFAALLRHLNIAEVQIEQCGGKTRLHDYIATLPMRPGFAELSVVAITRDADEDANGAFQSVCAALRNVHLVTPPRSGTFVDGEPRVGIFILPDCEQRGMLEDLCLGSIGLDLAMPCVDEFMRCIERNGRQPNNISKARIHVWLASQVEPDKRLGEAALAGFWNWDDPTFDLLKRFLRQL